MKYLINLSILRRNRNFRLLFTGQSISFFGTMVTSVALPFQVYYQTHSTLMVGLLSLAQLVPLLVTALIGGVLADRHHRRMLLMVAELFMAIGCLFLALNAHQTVPSLWVLFIVAPLMSGFNGLHRPAFDSIKQQIVSKQDFPAVSALLVSVMSLVMIIGPAVAGLIIAQYGLVATFMLDFVTYVICIYTVWRIQDVPRPQWQRDQSTVAALQSGLRYALSRQELMGTYFVDFFAMVFGMPNALFPAIAQTLGGVKILGLLYAAPAAGALAISVLSGWAREVKFYGKAIAVSASLWGVSIVFFGCTKNLYLALLFLALAGAFDAISGIFRSTLWNETIPNELRGRLAGIEMISYLSGPKLGDTESGLMAAAFGAPFAIVSGGAACVISVMLCCYFLPQFWRYRSTI